MELDFYKYCILDGGSTTTLSAPHRSSKAGYRKSNKKLECGKNGSDTLDESFVEIGYDCYRSTSCRDVQSERANHDLPKRGSLYQSSQEVNLVSKQNEPFIGKKTFELPRRSASMELTFGIIDSLCSLDEDRQITMEESTIKERDRALNLHKSLSYKLGLPHPPTRRKPNSFVKPRSQKHPMYCPEETICKPLVKGCSDNHISAFLSSPAHLHGILKPQNKNGVHFFEFSLNSPEDVYYVSRMWWLDNSLTWVYTFHSLDRSRRKSNAKVWGFKDDSRESTMIGQMAVSSYLCTELKGPGSLTNSMVTEYVLYDIAQSRSSFSRDDSRYENKEVTTKSMNNGRMCKHTRPLAAEELGPELETAAVIMRTPFEKRESLKYKCGDIKIINSNKTHPSLLDLCQLEEGICENSSRGEMHVVVPAGNHGLPSVDFRGSLPLLDRWRSGGGCECGGWDMGCPLDVFVNPDFRVSGGEPLMDGRHPVGLFVKGKQDSDIPAFNMRATKDGKYAVDFHAQLTSLQAFSICVSILHAAEASAAVGHVPSKQTLHSDSPKVFPEEEIKNLMDTISEEKFKANNCKKKEQAFASRSFVLNPPSSPIGEYRL